MHILARRHLLCKSQMKPSQALLGVLSPPSFTEVPPYYGPEPESSHLHWFSKGPGTLERQPQTSSTVMFQSDENNYPEQVRRITFPAPFSNYIWLLVCWKCLFPLTKELLLPPVTLFVCSDPKPCPAWRIHSFLHLLHGSIPKLWSGHLCRDWGSGMQQGSP